MAHVYLNRRYVRDPEFFGTRVGCHVSAVGSINRGWKRNLALVSGSITHSCKIHYLSSVVSPTVTKFNSCTKCVGERGKLHERTTDCHLVSWAWMHV